MCVRVYALCVQYNNNNNDDDDNISLGGFHCVREKLIKRLYIAFARAN